ncbi:helix-turn-helix domain-containing protein [Christiangramia flava]|nr:AraC family transcriptional regulator [Christiangramia flava]
MMKTFSFEIEGNSCIFDSLSSERDIYKEEENFKIFNLPQDLGTGVIEFYKLNEELNYYRWTGKINQSIKITFNFPKGWPFNLFQSFVGQLYFVPEQEIKVLYPYQQLIFNPLQNSKISFIPPINCNFQYSYIQIFKKKKSRHHTPFPLYSQLVKIPHSDKLVIEESCNQSLIRIGQELAKINRFNSGRQIYVQAKVLEIISMAQSSFNRKSDLQLQGISSYEYNKLQEAKNYIEANFHTIKRIQEIAYQINLPINSLQHLFKICEGQTINEYLKNYRLKYAWNHINEGKTTISDIVYRIGLTSRSYFSKIFKNKYGYYPSKLLEMNSISNKTKD